MKSLFVICLSLVGIANIFSQNKNSEIDAIVREGEYMYRLEMASWNGNDIFLQNYENKNHIGGYFSYIANDSATCVFYTKGDYPSVLGSVTFDFTFKPQNATMRIGERDFSENENELYTIRKKAVLAINSDTIFKGYNNTSLNLIPMVYKGRKKAYILTGPRSTGVVILGNDYLIEFDEYDDIKNKKQLHRNIIPIEYNSNEPGDVTMHSHSEETGEFITPTDICTLMLYAPFTGWKTHYVISKNYVCIWDCIKNELAITTRLAWDKMPEKKKGKIKKEKN